MKSIINLYSLSCLIMALFISCVNNSEKIDDIIDDELTSYEYALSDSGIVKYIHSENSQIILYDSNFKQVDEIESFNWGGFLTNFGKDSIEISFSDAKSDFESTYFLDHIVKLGEYKISYRFLGYKGFGQSGEEIEIDSVSTKQNRFKIQLFKDKDLIEDVEIKDIGLGNNRITISRAKGDVVLTKVYKLSKGLTLHRIVEEILRGYREK